MSMDWRLQGQETFLRNAVLNEEYTPFRADWDHHDHCEFCGTKFSGQNGDETEGYSTKDGDHWICPLVASADFRQMFDWQVIDN